VPVAISGAALGTGATNYTTSTPHGFVNGEIIAITGITPSSYNTTAAVMVVNTTQFYIVGFNGTTGGAYASGGVATIVTNVKAVSQIWQGFPPTPSQVTFVQSFTGTAPDSTNRTTISWTCAATTTLNRFELYRKVGAGAFTAVNTNIGAGVRSYVVDGHAAATTYTYFVKSVANSGLTLSGAENSFTLTASAQPTDFILQQGVTSNSATWRARFPAGVFQKIQWYNLSYDGVNLYWELITSATLASNATTNDYTRTGLAERAGYWARYVLTNYNNHTTGSDVENQNYKSITTLNAPPNSPSLNGISTGPAQNPIPAVGSNSGFATSGEVLKYIGVNYTLAADTDFLNCEVYLYSGTSAPTTFVSSQVFTTAPGAAQAAWFYVLPNTKYWALVRQRDNNGGETDNATGWQSVTTPIVYSFTNANAFDTATGTTYSESAATTGMYTGVNYLTTAITYDSNYSGTLLHGGSTANTTDRSLTSYLSWKVVSSATSGQDTVGNINFAMRDARDSFLDYGIYATWLVFSVRKHNVVLQMYNSAGTWLGGGASSLVNTRNNQPTVIASLNNFDWDHNFSFATQSVKSTAAKGATTYGGAGNGGTPSWNMYLSIRNPVNVSPPYVHLTEYERIGLQYTTETSVTTYTTTPAVTRYY
jgi:hypothetical protein